MSAVRSDFFNDPYIDRSEDLMRKSDVVIESGQQDVRHLFWKILTQALGEKAVNFNNTGIMRLYTTLRSLAGLQAHAKLLSINGYTVCLLYPTSNQANHKSMVQFVKEASGLYGWGRTTNLMNLHHLLHFVTNRGETSPKGKPQVQAFLSETQQEQAKKIDFIVEAEGPFVAEEVEKELELAHIQVANLGEMDFIYPDLPLRKNEDAVDCYASCWFAQIDSQLVTFVHNSGTYSDTKAMKEKVREWCPHAKHILSPKEAVSHFARRDTGTME
jgi:hypothetical protein